MVMGSKPNSGNYFLDEIFFVLGEELGLGF